MQKYIEKIEQNFLRLIVEITDLKLENHYLLLF